MPIALRGCSWRAACVTEQSGGAALTRRRIRCRIPQGQGEPKNGDYLLLGRMDGGASLDGADAARLLNARECFRIARVEDRTCGPLGHYKCVSTTMD